MGWVIENTTPKKGWQIEEPEDDPKAAAKKPKADLLTKATGALANFNRGLFVGDEIAGALKGAVNAGGALARGEGLTAVPEAFREGMAGQRRLEDQFQETNPHSAALARGLGNTISLAGPSAPAGVLAASRAGNMARGAVTAGLSAAGYTAADRGTLGERVTGALEMARNPVVLGLGALGGALAPAAKRVKPAESDVLRAARILKAKGKADPDAMASVADEMRGVGVQPTGVDIIGEKGRRLTRAVGVKSEDAGETLVENAASMTASAKPSIMARTQKVGPMQGKTKDELVSDLFKARGEAATANYAPAYATQVPLNEQVLKALSDEPGKAALRRARAAAVARMDDGRVQEIDSILRLDQPDIAPAAVVSPKAPPINEDPRGQSLLSFLRARGGLKDDGGELAAIDLGRSRGRFQKDNVVNPNGMGLDEAAEAALEAGFFPNAKINIRGGDNYHPVTPQMLLDAIRKEAAGTPSAASSFAREQDFVASQRWADGADEALPPIDDDYWKAIERGVDTGKTVSAATLHRARIAMRERAQSAKQRNAGDLASGLNMRGAMLDDALEQVPEMAPANADYRAKTQALNVLGEGKKGGRADVFSTDPADYGRWLEGLSPEARQANKVAIRQEILDTLGGQRSSTFGSVDELATSEYAKANLAQALGEEAAPYLGFLRNRIKQVRNASFVSPNAGSRTAVLDNDLGAVQGVLAAADVTQKGLRGDVVGLANTAADWFRRMGVADKDASALARVVTDPKRVDELVSAIRAPGGVDRAKKMVRALDAAEQAANGALEKELIREASARLSRAVGGTAATSRPAPTVEVTVPALGYSGASYGRAGR